MKTMALNYVPLSHCVNLFVANQFRVCVRQTASPLHRCYSKYVRPWVPASTLQFRCRGNKRILCQQTSLCFWRDGQHFSTTPQLYNPHTSLVRAKYLGNKAGSEPELLPFMSKPGKNKKGTRVKSCLECRKKLSSKDKRKFNRQTIVPSPATAFNADLQSHTLLKPPKGRKSGGAQNEVILFSQVAKEMVDCFNKFVDCLNKVDNTMRTGISRHTDGSIPLILPVREVANPRKSSNLAADMKIKRPKTAGKKPQSEKKKKKTSETGNILEKANPELNQIRWESCSLKNSVGDRELLEILPKFVENLQAEKSLIDSKKVHTTTESKNEPNKEIKTDVQKDGFILAEQKFTNIMENKVEPKNQEGRNQDGIPHNEGRNQDGIPHNETGFILLYPEESKRDQSSVYCSQPEEKGFILVSDKEKCDYGQRRSKEDNRNFVVVNDNPFCNPRSTRTSHDESKKSQVSNVKDVLPRPDIQVQPHMVDKKTLGCASLNSKYEGNAVNRISSILDNQAIGSSDSKEELKRQHKTVGDVQAHSIVDHEGQNPDDALHLQSLDLKPHRWMSKGKYEDVGPKTSEQAENKILSKDKVATCKYTDDSSKGINSMNDEGAYTNGVDTTKRGAIKPESNATKNGDIKKGNRQFQGGIIGSKSAHDLHVDAFGNAIKGYLKLNLEAAMEKKKSGKKGVKHTNSFVNLATNERPKSPTKETSPSFVEVGHETNIGNLKKLHTNTLAPCENTADCNSCNFRHQRSPASVVHELKPDLLQKKLDRRSPKAKVAVAKASIEPQLFVKPEEMSNKTKCVSRPETSMLYSTEQHISPIIASSTCSSLAKNPTEEGFASPPKSMLDAKEELQQLSKTHSQEMNKREKNILSEQDKNQMAPPIPPKETIGFSSARSEASSDQVTKVMTLSDVFRQLQHTRDTKMARPSSTRANNFYAVAAKTRNPRKNDELVRIIRQQWSQDFQEKWHNLQPISLYSPCGGNCSPEAAKNSNTSAGSRPKKDKKVSPSVVGKSKHGSSPVANMVQVNRKSEHLPTMGMAERLLAASQRPSGTPETNCLSPNIKGSAVSISSHNTDGTVTPGTAEVDELPQVDQFEEWVQNKIPEICNDNKWKTTSTEEMKVGLPPNTSTNDGLKVSNSEPVDDLRIYEGSNVDGDFLTQTSIQQSKTSDYAKPAIDNKQLYNSTTAKTIINYGHPDKNILDTSCGTHPKALFGEISASMTDTSVRSGPSANGAFLSQDRYSSNDNLTKTTSFAREIGSAMNISHGGPSKPTSATTNTGRGSKGVPLSKSTKLKSLNGFASMTVIEAPQNSPSRNLKPSLKRSPSRERSEEKRVSFEKMAKDDRMMERYNKQFDRYVGSSVDRPRAEDSFGGENNSNESDLRSELAKERKREEMDARIKLLNEHSKQIREYEAVLSKYRDIVTKFRDDALKVIRGRGSEDKKSSEV